MMPPGPPGPPGNDDSRNLFLAMGLLLALFFVVEIFFIAPQRQSQQAALKARAAVEQQQAAANPAPNAPPKPLAREVALTQSPRIVFDTPTIDGSINLLGARIDDLSMKDYHQTVERKAEVTLLRPMSAARGFDAFFGWENAAGPDAGVNAQTQWAAPEGAKLTTETPVTLTATTADGLTISRTISVNASYVFTIADTVTNPTKAAAAIRPFATVRRMGLPEDFIPNQIVHQGLLGVFGPEKVLHEKLYQAAQKHVQEKAQGKKLADTRLFEAAGTGGWLGFSDHYWLAALLPDQKEKIEGWYDARPEGANADASALYGGSANNLCKSEATALCNLRAAYRGAERTLAPGASLTYTQHFYAGAKRVDDLRAAQMALGLPDFDKAVDWGFLWFLTRPFFWLLDLLGGWLGNFGLAIMAATVVIKLILFPLVNQSYEAMSKLKKIQPKMKEIQERFAADKQRQQQEMIKLYQTEKVNPVAGCLPILVQIPIFYALYKVLTVTIEMRHAPFFGWIQDLSAKDPTSWINLFGILPFDAGAVTAIPFIGGLFAVGVWPILYGVTMWGVTALQPPAPDPIQRQVFALLPVLFVFLFAGFAAGLVIYWTWSNVLSILQQYFIMRKNGVETEFDKLWAKYVAKTAGGAAK